MIKNIASALRALGHEVDFTEVPVFYHGNEFVEVRSRQITAKADDHLAFAVADAIHAEYPNRTIWLREWRSVDQIIRFGVSHGRLKKPQRRTPRPSRIIEIHPPY